MYKKARQTNSSAEAYEYRGLVYICTRVVCYSRRYNERQREYGDQKSGIKTISWSPDWRPGGNQEVIESGTKREYKPNEKK